MPVTINYPDSQDAQSTQMGGPTGDRITADWGNKVQKSWEAGQTYLGYTTHTEANASITGRVVKIEKLINGYRGTAIDSDTLVAATISAMPVVGDVLLITGTTQIEDILASGTRRVTLHFQDDGCIVDNTGHIFLDRIFTSYADSTLTLESDGVNWFEVCRSNQRDITDLASAGGSFITMAKWGL